MRWVAPFGADDAKPIYEVEGSITSAQWGSDGKTLFVTETSSGSTTTFAVSLADTSKKQSIQTRRAPAPAATGAGTGTGQRPGGAQTPDDFYDNPGSWVTEPNENGIGTILVSGKNEVYLQGTQYFRDPEKEAPRPFLDAVSLADGKKRRVWQSSPALYETIGAILDADAGRLVLTRQSSTMLPNSYLVSTGGGEPKALTFNTDYAPEVTGAQRHRIRLERADGFKFWVEVTVPRNHVKGDRMPAFFWFYPSEFNDQAGYDRTKRTYNKNSFPAVGTSSKDLLILLGYAVVEPDCPIVGPAGRMNDSYIPDLRANLYATINVLEKEGYIDRSKLGLGGHSYGAFSTANAMIHTPFFKAGIAGDGAYNRMLTPMAFQSEQRLLWEARETYLTMSPLLYAEQFNGALLMYHGADDQNVGTHPINSERMFHALDGLGKTAAMYMYPYEDHGPAAKETHLDLWARWIAWLDKYVKGTP
jgi:dipeptidyl aminopeptidase/acylaminoacyl peptidase